MIQRTPTMLDLLWDRIEDKDKAIIEPFLRDVPVKVGALADELGLKVSRSVLPPNISGLIRPNSEARSGYEVKVNKFESNERQRFTIAHEIAHYLIHRDFIGNGVVDSIMYRSALTSKKEAEANRIAADIVMPRAVLNREIAGIRRENLSDSLNEIASRFRVSSSAMEVRLGLV